MSTTTPAQRLAAAVRTRRQDDLRLNQLEVAAAGGPSNTLQTDIELGRIKTLTTRTARKIDDGLMWEQGSALRVWEGRGEPTPRGVGVQADGSLWLSDNARDIQALRDFLARVDKEGDGIIPPEGPLRLWDFEQLMRAAILKYRDETELLNHMLRVMRTSPARKGGEQRADRSEEQEPTRHLGVAAHDEDHSIEDEQGHDETP